MTAVDAACIVVLSGPSCSGKTTVARALKDILSTSSRPWLHIEADRFLPHLPASWPTGAAAHQSTMSRALHRAAVSFADEGFDLIVDGTLPYNRPRETADALALLDRYRLCYVGVYCALDVLQDRERRRPDRVPGWAATQNIDLHEGVSYDIKIDTTHVSALENATTIRQYLTARGGL